jgi:serine protease AprX
MRRSSSSSGLRAFSSVSLCLAVLLLRGDARGQPQDAEADETIRGPWTGEPYRAVRDVNGKGFLDLVGTRHATPQAVVEADAAKVDPLRLILADDLAEIATDPLRADELVLVTVLFRNQPLHDAGTAARERYGEEVGAAVDRMHAVLARIAPFRKVGGAEERIHIHDVLEEEERLLTTEEKAALRRDRDFVLAALSSMRREALADAAPLVDRSQAPLRAFLETVPNARFVSHSICLNALTASVPAGMLLRFVREFPEVARIERDRVHRAELDTSTFTIGADNWWNAGYLGSSSTPVAILDSGVDTNHPGLAGGFTGSAVFHASARYASDYNDNRTSVDDLEGHGTHIAGIVASYDTTYAGVAPGAYLLNTKVAYLTTSGSASAFDSDVRAGADWAANNGAVAMNYSYGSSSSTTDGSSAASLYFDGVSYGLAIPVTISAGNSGSSASTITTPGDTYNVVTVGDFDDWDTTTTSDDFLASASSRGPTSDGRRKPDIAAPGEYIKSCAHNWEGSNPNFVDMSGTSMAAPHVAGGMAILLDYGAAAYPEGLKALLVGTAAHTSPYGTSPGNAWGYGALDLGRAYAYRASVKEGTLASSANYVFLRVGSLSTGGRITLTWNRHVLSNGTSAVTTYYALTDLDLYAYDESTNASLGSSTSSVNNVEQVALNSGSSNLVVQIYRYGSLPTGVATEYWGVAAESSGATTVVAPPSLGCSFSSLPTAVQAGATFNVAVTVANAGGLRAFAPAVSLTLPSGYTIASGANPQTVGNVAAGGTALATWSLTAPSGTAGTKTFQALATSNSYEETFTSATVSATQKLDPDSPTGSISVPAYVSQPMVVATLSATDATTSVVSMRLRQAGANWGSWTNFATTATIPLTSGDGAKTVEAEFSDAAGNVSATASAVVVIDSVAPTASVVLNGGSEFWNDRIVPVSVVGSDALAGVSQMRFSSNGSTWRAWRAFGPLTSEQLLDSDSEQTVFAQLMDAAGNLSTVVSDSITLDRSKPSGTVRLLDAAEYARPWLPLTAVLQLQADLSGVDVVRYSTDGGNTWTDWLPYAGAAVEVSVPASAGDRVLTATFEARDRAKNVSDPFSDSIHVLARDPQDLSLTSSLRGGLAPGGDVDAYRVDLVAGQVLTVKVASKAATKHADVQVALDLFDPADALVVEGRFPTAARKAGIVKFPILSTGRHTLVVRSAGADASVGASYTITVVAATPSSVKKQSGVTADEPGVGSSVSFDAAGGWEVSGVFATTSLATPELEMPDGQQTGLPSLRAAGRTRARLVAAPLAGPVGSYRVVLPGVAGGTAYTLTLTQPRRSRTAEAIAQ